MEQLELPFPDDAAPAGRRVPDDRRGGQARALLRADDRRAIDNGALRAGRVRGAAGSRGGFRIRPADLERWVFSDAS